MPSKDGLRWEETLFDLVPEWTRDPSIAAIETVCRQQFSIPPEETCSVAFHASGLFNKLYSVERPDGTHLIMRVSLPVYPRHKTRAEVATLRNDNLIGFEWILMELMDGTPAHTRWRAMSMGQKVAFTERVAKFQAELSGFGKSESIFRGVGALDLDNTDDVKDSKGVAPGLLVSHEFFMGGHLCYDIPRGPFRSSHDWLIAELDIILRHQTAILENSEDEDDREDAKNVSSVARKLLALVPKFFPAALEEPEMTALYHHDLHLNNILVNEQGEITAVLDWECVSAMPLWMSTKLPRFLEGPVREEEPQKDKYLDADQIPHESTAAVGKSGLEDQGKNDLYFIHQMEYEATQLRKVYKARLKELWPEWPLEEKHAEIDLFQAISQCDGIWMKRIGRWADRLENGETIQFDISNA
ncbi:hypothetical protein CONLIGDRAFT_693111 [Coniochaeta ligniaria NRRL 30616]|uniref:Aminoglycoside phosphotransferase domain-containing protein n=1 Tax=Coniochaeta ligniaria NRRL 30616 TaxID=1408157 RepID=A0A1J7J7B0_9PEZI|nr:hypothetical protein CONLIGDRAFT_693111 [Coniochaeta ligniaria NRRL 30616]